MNYEQLHSRSCDQSRHSRRDFLHRLPVAASLPWLAATVRADEPLVALEIGTRRELLLDEFLIERRAGAELKLHKPIPRDVVLVCDAPWEGNVSGYFTLFQDGDVFRMYYRGAHYDESTKQQTHEQFTCYAESRDGLHWEKPNLGLFEFNGSKENNIVWAGEGTHNFTPFRDENPDCAADAKYKAVATGKNPMTDRPCLKAFKSPDGIHWSMISNDPIITDGNFDSQNLAFWHPERKCYFDYHRKARRHGGERDVMMATSKDFKNWTKPAFLEYADARKEHLYTNAVQSYFRAPHLFVALPTRFTPRTQRVEPVLMTSRDGLHFQRWASPLIPVTAPQDRDGNRSNYMTRGMLQLPGQSNEISVYATEAYYRGPGSRVRRFTYRTDGFVSLNVPETGEMLTRPLRFDGSRLEINARTSKSGSIRAELCNQAGQPLPGFAAEDCVPFSGDEIAWSVKWNRESDLSAHAGNAVRLRFILQEADLFALKFSH